MKTKEIKLTTDNIARLAKLRAQIIALTNEEEYLCQGLKDRMVEKKVDEFGPPASPWKLSLSISTKITTDYESWVEDMLKAAYGDYTWKKHFNSNKKKYGSSTKVLRLRIPNNELWNGGTGSASKQSEAVALTSRRRIRLEKQ